MATVIELTLGAVPKALRDVWQRDAEALRFATARTLLIDAPRWIQWSIKGGDASIGWNMPARVLPPPPPEKKKTPKRRGKKRRPESEFKQWYVQEVLGGVKSGTCKTRPAPTGYRQPVDTGDYKNSWTTQMLDDGGIFYSQPLYSPAKSGVIEEGRRAKWIPIEPLAQWVRRKMNCKDPRAAKSIAFAISRHASRVKRPGVFVLKRAHPKIAEAFRQNLEHAIGRAVSLQSTGKLFG